MEQLPFISQSADLRIGVIAFIGVCVALLWSLARYMEGAMARRSPKSYRPSRRSLAAWAGVTDPWWQFWRSTSGIPGGVIMGAIAFIILTILIHLFGA